MKKLLALVAAVLLALPAVAPAQGLGPVPPNHIGIGTATSLAIGGCAIGADKLCVTGTTKLTGQAINQGLTTTSPGWYAQITGDSTPRVRVGLNATDVASIALGSGAGARDLFIERAGAASLRLGAPDAAAPVAQALSVQNVVAGTSNTAGSDLTLKLSQGTGTGIGGNFVVQGAPHGSAGSTVNALATAFTINGDTKAATFGGTISAPSISGLNSVFLSAATAINWSGRGSLQSVGDGQYQFGNNAATNAFTITAGASGKATFGGEIASTGDIFSPAGASIYWVARAVLKSPTTSSIRLLDATQTITADMTISGASGTGASLLTHGGPIAAPSLALGGATIGADALGVTGSASFSSTVSAVGEVRGQNFRVSPNTGVVYFLTSTELRAPANGALEINDTAGTHSFTVSAPGLTATPIFQHGAADAAAPVAQTIGVQNVVGGTTNTAGVNTVWNLSRGTGTGIGGNLTINGAPHSTTGSTQNTLVPALTLNGDTLAATLGGDLTLPAAGKLIWTGRASVESDATNRFLYKNNGATNSFSITIGGSNEAIYSGGISGSTFYLDSANPIQFDHGISNNYNIRKTGTTLGFVTGGAFGFTDPTGAFGFSVTPVVAATMQLGVADAAAPVAQTLTVQGVVAGTSNTAGANFTLAGSKGTGTGAGGSLLFKVAPAGSTGSTQNTLSTALTIASDLSATFTGPITTTGTAAAATITMINDTTGPRLSTSRFRAGSTAVVAGDELWSWLGYGYDGATTILSSAIQSKVDATPGTNDMPSNLLFLTAPDGSATITEHMRLDNRGDLWFKGVIPTVTGTGTPTIAAGSTDTSGEATGGASATSIVITFSATKANAPFCTVTPQTQVAAFAYAISMSAITVTQTATSGQKIDYHCTQH